MVETQHIWGGGVEICVLYKEVERCWKEEHVCLLYRIGSMDDLFKPVG